jgi:hypothetical protein
MVQVIQLATSGSTGQVTSLATKLAKPNWLLQVLLHFWSNERLASMNQFLYNTRQTNSSNLIKMTLKNTNKLNMILK